MYLRKVKYTAFNSTPSISAHTLVLALLLQFFPAPGPQQPFFRLHLYMEILFYLMD